MLTTGLIFQKSKPNDKGETTEFLKGNLFGIIPVFIRNASENERKYNKVYGKEPDKILAIADVEMKNIVEYYMKKASGNNQSSGSTGTDNAPKDRW